MTTLRTAIVLSMWSGSSVFGAMRLVVTPDPPVLDVAGRCVLTIGFENPDGVNVWGYLLKGATSPPNALVITERIPLGAATDPTVATVVGLMLEQLNDIGFTGQVGVGNNTAYVPAMMLGVQLAAGVGPPLRSQGWLTFTAIPTDVDFVDQPMLTWTSSPEPSGLLLAVCAGFSFARRRRVA